MGIHYDEILQCVTCGDVDFEDCFEKTKMITKVPGCLGPLNVAFAFQKLFNNFKMNIQ